MDDTPDVGVRLVSAQEDLEAVRALWREYWNQLGLSPDFQNFTEELKGLPGAYSAPDGRLLLAVKDGVAAGCGAVRKLEENRCEAKRFYVRPQFRRMGVGSALMNALLNEARAAGYREMYADTLKTLTAALRMYAEFGFVEVGPYSAQPTPGAVFLRLTL